MTEQETTALALYQAALELQDHSDAANMSLGIALQNFKIAWAVMELRDT